MSSLLSMDIDGRAASTLAQRPRFSGPVSNCIRGLLKEKLFLVHVPYLCAWEEIRLPTKVNKTDSRFPLGIWTTGLDHHGSSSFSVRFLRNGIAPPVVQNISSRFEGGSDVFWPWGMIPCNMNSSCKNNFDSFSTADVVTVEAPKPNDNKWKPLPLSRLACPLIWHMAHFHSLWAGWIHLCNDVFLYKMTPLPHSPFKKFTFEADGRSTKYIPFDVHWLNLSLSWHQIPNEIVHPLWKIENGILVCRCRKIKVPSSFDAARLSRAPLMESCWP